MKSNFCTPIFRMCSGFHPTYTLAIVETGLAVNHFPASSAEWNFPD